MKVHFWILFWKLIYSASISKYLEWPDSMISMHVNVGNLLDNNRNLCKIDGNHMLCTT